MTEKKDNNKKILNLILDDYLRNRNYKEFEIRFGINTKNNPLTRNSFEEIIKKYKSYGFKLKEEEGEYHLNINLQYRDVRTGLNKISNIRTEIHGLSNIQEYCRKNRFNIEEVPDYIKFTKKGGVKAHWPDELKKLGIENQYLPSIVYNNFEFKINYKKEEQLIANDRYVRVLLESWDDSKKIFRYIKRYTLIHPSYPFKIDCSVIKSSKQRKNNRNQYWMIPQYNIKDAGVFDNFEQFEIELELTNESIYWKELNKKYPILNQDKINEVNNNIIKKGIKMTLSAIQKTNFPISYDEQSKILREYIDLTYNNKKNKIKKDELLQDRTDYRLQNRKNFIGPSTVSLELKHLINNEDSINLHKYYTVTDKADGERHLLYIANNGKIYLIDINLNIKFTGCKVNNKKIYNTILDGELILHNKKDDYINRFLVFDLYFINKEDYRMYPLYNAPDMKYKKQIDKKKFRLNMLNAVIQVLTLKNGLVSIVPNKSPSMKIDAKTFYNNINNSIYSQCNQILNKNKDQLFDYEIDGLIFTPIDKSVGSNEIGEHSQEKTWLSSFKWKPPEYNTIDFLITTKKNSGSYDIISNLFQDGINNTKIDSIVQYKTIILRVGFSQKNHGFLNPQENIIQNVYPKQTSYYNDYKPVPFYPTDPKPNYDIHICNIPLIKIGNKQYMMTEDKKEIFDNDTIVEFRFDKNAKAHWQWIPIRVRHDKTFAYKKGKNNFGNDYKTANSVWKSINNPITENMICSGDNIPDYIDEELVYYKKKTTGTTTRALRNFHNKYVKHKLIKKVSKKGDYLLDMSVGKAGDLFKWIDSQLSVVIGLDVMRDNIENQSDGACTRYIKQKQYRKNIPKAMFLRADSGLNILNGEAFFEEKSKNIMKAIYGKGIKDKDKLGEGIYNLYGAGKDGFDIISNQFSIHYFFEHKEKFLEFVQNVSENCKKNGYFIGTCYNGKKIFNLLKNISINESIVKKTEKNTISWSIKKKYKHNEFNNDITSLGYKIDIYQESINQTLSEYLVNFDYFTNILEQFGFILCPRKDLKTMYFKNAIGSFEHLYNEMEENINNGLLKEKIVGDALKMTSIEKDVSFLNNYFIYKKVRLVNSEKVKKIILDNINNNINRDDNKINELYDEILNESKKIRRNAIKYKKKIILSYNQSNDDNKNNKSKK